MLIEYVFNPSADGSVIKQQSIKLSCIFIMYFLSFFHFPNQKFISASSLSVWLRPRGGGEGFEVLLSLAGQRKRAPRLRDPPKPHPPPPSRAGGWWEGGASILGADFLFTFSWGHSAGWPCPSVSLQHFNSSFNWNLRQTAQNPPAADPSTFHISNISDVRFKVWVHQDVTRQSVDFIIVARADGAEEEVLFGSDWEPDDSSVSQRPAACPAVQPVLLQTEPSFTTWTSRCVVEYTDFIHSLVFTYIHLICGRHEETKSPLTQTEIYAVFPSDPPARLCSVWPGSSAQCSRELLFHYNRYQGRSLSDDMLLWCQTSDCTSNSNTINKPF